MESNEKSVKIPTLLSIKTCKCDVEIKNVPEIMRMYNNKIELPLKYYKIKSKLLCKANNAFDKNCVERL